MCEIFLLKKKTSFLKMAQGPLAKKFKGSANKRIINKSKSNSNSSSHGLGPKKGGKFFQFIKKKITWF